MNDKKEKEAHLSKEAPFLHLGRLRIYGEPREFSSEDETGESGTSRLEDCSVNAKVEEKEQEKGFPTSPDNPSSPDKKAGGLLKEEVTPNGELASSSSSSSGNTVALFLASVLTSPFMPPQSSAPRDLPLVGSQRTLYDQILNTPSSRAFNLITPMWEQPRNGKQMIDICVDPSSPIAGFIAMVKHGHEEGVLSQTKLVSVLAMVTSESKGEVISFRQIGRFILPKTLPKTCLGFEFTSETTPSQSSPSPPSLALSQSRSVQANILRFQFLSNYGGRETQPPKIYLFSSTLTTAVSG